jgi:hypothetical protein
MGVIASGALLIVVDPDDREAVTSNSCKMVLSVRQLVN